MASELAPRLHLAAIIRIILVFFAVAALPNVQTYIGSFWSFSGVYGATVTSWVAVGWNALLVMAASVHPYLQRMADGLPFPIKVTVRGKVILAYGDSDSDGDGLMAPLAGKLSISFVDTVLATLLLAFMLVSRDYSIECRDPLCLGASFHVSKWILNAWLAILIFQYALALIQLFEAGGIWYNRRYLRKRGQISLA